MNENEMKNKISEVNFDKETLVNLIEEVENNLKNGEKVSKKDINELIELVKDCEGLTDIDMYLLNRRIFNIENQISDRKISLTKWDIFVEDMLKRDGIDNIKTLLLYIDKRKNDTISQEGIDKIEDMYSECLADLKKKLSRDDNERAIKEIEKKIKLFNNRRSRIIEEDFGSWIKQLRLSRGLSLKGLEKCSGVTASYIHRIENGVRRTPSVPVAEKLAMGLKVDKKEFLKKLNLYDDFSETTTSTKKELLPLNEFLALNDFIINDKPVTKKQKDSLIKLLKEIIEKVPGKEDSYTYSINVMKRVNAFKETIEKEDDDIQKEASIDKVD